MPINDIAKEKTNEIEKLVCGFGYPFFGMCWSSGQQGRYILLCERGRGDFYICICWADFEELIFKGGLDK
jgi:hypothetical protein